MKKGLTGTIILAVVTAVILVCCVFSRPKLDKFIGEWQRVDKPEKNNYIIAAEDDAIIGVFGKDTCAGIYEKKRDVLKFYVLGQAGIISCNKTTGHLLFNKGDDGEFRRVK